MSFDGRCRDALMEIAEIFGLDTTSENLPTNVVAVAREARSDFDVDDWDDLLDDALGVEEDDDEEVEVVDEVVYIEES